MKSLVDIQNEVTAKFKEIEMRSKSLGIAVSQDYVNGTRDGVSAVVHTFLEQFELERTIYTLKTIDPEETAEGETVKQFSENYFEDKIEAVPETWNDIN